MPFQSILFPDEPTPEAPPPAADTIADLHLDDIVASITAGREAYELVPLFLAPAPDVATIRHRHAVFRDLASAGLAGPIRDFAARMRIVRERLGRADGRGYRLEKARWFLDAALAYRDALVRLVRDLEREPPASAALTDLQGALADYVTSPGFQRLSRDADRVKAALDGVTYRLLISGLRIRVTRPEGEPDYGSEVLETFAKFRRSAPPGVDEEAGRTRSMNHVEAAILDRVALLHPEAFTALEGFRHGHEGFVDATVARFDREVQFFLAYLEYMARFAPRGLAFCYPSVADRPSRMHARGLFDLALAGRLLEEGGTVVVNDFALRTPERVIVVTGPNQGGKTTFARAIGQLHHLARIGCPVPGSEAHVARVDHVFTHFERPEDLDDLSGKLEEDLRRIHAILEAASERSLLVMNESFSSTTSDDALLLNTAVMRQILERGLLCVAVTFLDELASLDPATVSMVGEVDPDDPARRTFRIERRPADGLAYAQAIAEKHGLSYETVRRRLAA